MAEWEGKKGEKGKPATGREAAVDGTEPTSRSKWI